MLNAQDSDMTDLEKISDDKVKKAKTEKNIISKDKKKLKNAKKNKPDAKSVKASADAVPIIRTKSSNWISSEFIKSNKFIPGLTETEVEYSAAPTNEVPNKIEKVEVKKTNPKAETKKTNIFYDFLTENYRIILIITALLFFALYRMRSSGPKGLDKVDRFYSKHRNKN
jgi:hypothetical protein